MQKEIDLVLKSAFANNLSFSVTDLIKIAEKLIDGNYQNELIHAFLECGHLPAVNNLFYNSELQEKWLSALFKLVLKSNYHTGFMLKQRAERYSTQPLFKLISGKKIDEITYSDAWQLIGSIGLSLMALTENVKDPVIGLYMPNSIETALIDLACLSFNFKIVPIPTNVSRDHLKYILRHSKITHLFVDGSEQINSLKYVSNDFEHLKIISLLKTNLLESPLSWQAFNELGHEMDKGKLDHRLQKFQMDTDATIMYTSGTTANPKGIIFTQGNIITKRFARALALPNICSDDSFLCYLPLYHTFGRYLELMGAIFWGATYCFAESPSFKSLLKNMTVVRPTIFISIPKRWFQLYETLTVQSSDIDQNNLKKYIDRVTGGKLRLGLSAAGYLDPDIFTFFQKNGIQLLSGYGMTEATGGITMTPENDYIKDSVGKPLPGIELKLGQDDELLLKGPYVISHYHGTEKASALRNGWFHTGDIFKEDGGHYFIIDRKKEIYKNSRGITISPQKIENLFQDFEVVKSVFLVGDGQPYNTVLIYPDKKWLKNFEQENDLNISEYFSSLIQSVNSFLAQHERIVNYALIERNFSADKNELTLKKTYKRKIILKNFDKYIAPLYEKDYHSLIVDGNEIRIPKWLLRKSRMIYNDLIWDGNTLSIRNTDKNLSVVFNDADIIIGDYRYYIRNNVVDIRKMVNPKLWIGNQTFVEFFGFQAILPNAFEEIQDINFSRINFKPGTANIPTTFIDAIKTALRDKIFDLETIHQSAVILLNTTGYNISIAINYFSKLLSIDKRELVDLALTILKRLRYHTDFKIRIRALEVMTPYLTGEAFIEYLTEIYNSSENPKILKDLALDVRLLKQHHFKSILDKLAELRHHSNDFTANEKILIEALLNTITEFGINHPTEFKWARSELVKWNLSHRSQEWFNLTNLLINKLINGFRIWLGDNRQNAIDTDTGEEYTWSDVIVFDPNVEERHKQVLLSSITNTTLLKEAIFLLTSYKIVELDDIQTRGVWIMHLGSNHGKSVFRITIQTRSLNNYNFVINYNNDLSDELITNEVKWLITTGSSSKGIKLVEDFGGYWSDYKVFAEEYIQGETLFQYLERNRSQISSGDNTDIWELRWMHFVWNGLMAYFSFYNRTNFSLYIANSSIKNLIIPEFDYAIGTRLISISDKAPLENKLQLFTSLYEKFILQTEKEYTGLPHVADWEVIFCALLQTVRVRTGIDILKIVATELGDSNKNGLSKSRIYNFIDEINENGLLTKQVVFASLRYERWLALNPQATLQARSTMIRQLYQDYNLAELIDDYPETRIRYFLMTAFKDSNEKLQNELLLIQKGLRAKTISALELEEHINLTIKKVNPNEDDKYFITRILFEHIDSPKEGTEFVWESDTEGKIELISGVSDSFGEHHQIRQPNHPKEIAKFQSLLLNSNLSAVFTQQHEFLLLFNANNQLIGGTFWKKVDDTTAYLERIVIHPKYQKRHLSSHLLDELFNRLRNKRYNYITVGFFQAGLFYNKGFNIDNRFGGLVRTLM